MFYPPLLQYRCNPPLLQYQFIPFPLIYKVATALL